MIASRAFHPPRSPRVAFWAVFVLVTIAKLAIVFAGPDYDGDAYAHAMSGRRMWLDPGDVTVHWVWLPLLHALYAVAAYFGSGLTALRVTNALVSSLSALVLAHLLKIHLSAKPTSGAGNSTSSDLDSSLLPWLAAALLIADPLCIWLGVTGQTEPLFQLFILLGCALYQRRVFVFAGASFAVAALTRYEAWPLLPVLFWLAVRRDREDQSEGLPPLVVLAASPLRAPVPPKRRASAPRGGPTSDGASLLRAQALWILPSLAVAGWCLFHYRATGEPLQFLRFNREFVEGYLNGVGYPWGRQPILPLMAVFYVTVVPVWNMLGPAYMLAFAGIPRAIRDLPRSFLLVSVALVAIVTAGFLRRTHLGLPRHAVAFAPFFCALVALGTQALTEIVSRRLANDRSPQDSPSSAGAAQSRCRCRCRCRCRLPSPSPSPSPNIAVTANRTRFGRIAALTVLALVLLTRTVPKTIELWNVTRRAFEEQAIAARALRDIASPGEAIFCDDGKIEVLSAIAPDRFVRWQIPDVSPSHVADLARQKGSALVIATPPRAAHLPGGHVVWQGDRLAILRFDAASTP